MSSPFNLRERAEHDVVGFGTNAVDHLIRVPSFPQFDSKLEFLGHSVDAGGEVASTMVGLRRLGKKTKYVGRFGSDTEGNLGLDSLVNEGVDISGSEMVESAHTQTAFIMIDDSTGERTILWHRDSKLAYTAKDAPITFASEGKILHVTPHDIEACIVMAKAAREAGTIVSLDVDKTFDGIDRLLPLTDICITSATFPGMLLGITELKASLKTIAERFGCSVTGATLGADGSMIFCNGDFVETPAFSVPGGCVDTTGAGDAFRAGFLYGVLSGNSVEDCAVAANAVAALKCRSLGARSGLPGEAELSDLIGKADL